MAIADTGKAEAQPLSPDAYQAQQAEIARLSQAVQLAEVENQGLRARVAEVLSFVSRYPQFAHEFPSSVTVSIETPLGAPQNLPICPQEPPVPVLAGDSSEYAGMPWEGRP